MPSGKFLLLRESVASKAEGTGLTGADGKVKGGNELMECVSIYWSIWVDMSLKYTGNCLD